MYESIFVSIHFVDGSKNHTLDTFGSTKKYGLAGAQRGVPVYGPTAAADAQQDQHASSARAQSGVPVRRPTAAANARGGQRDEPSLWGHSEADGAASAFADLAELQRSGLHMVWPSCLREQAPAAQVEAFGETPEGMGVCTDTGRPQPREGGVPAADAAALRDLAELQELGCQLCGRSDFLCCLGIWAGIVSLKWGLQRAGYGLWLVH